MNYFNVPGDAWKRALAHGKLELARLEGLAKKTGSNRYKQMVANLQDFIRSAQDEKGNLGSAAR